MNESKLTAKVTGIWVKRGALIIPLAGGSRFQPAGLADRIVIWRKRTMFVEFKGVNTVIEPHQMRWYNDIRAHGGHSFFVRHLPDGETVLINEAVTVDRFNALESLWRSCDA